MNDALTAELVVMMDADQAAHNATVGADGRYLPQGHAVYAAWRECLQGHTVRLKEIVAEYGWPTISMVGRRAAKAAWLVAQHSDHDVAFQREVLELMTALLPGDEVDATELAYLTDRVARAEGRPQEYGTQLQDQDGEVGLQPVREPKQLDARRAAVGLGPVAEYLAEARKLPRHGGEKRDEDQQTQVE
jgi:hypothetical protein